MLPLHGLLFLVTHTCQIINIKPILLSVFYEIEIAELLGIFLSMELQLAGNLNTLAC
jgi:hypothetical protein